MKPQKASKPREIGINQEAMHLPRNGDVTLAICRYEQRKVARRNFSVFDQLATNGKTVGDVIYPPTLTKAQAVAGNNMFNLYAIWRGMGGAGEREEIGFIEGGTVERELLTDRMKIAGEMWRFIITGHDKNGYHNHTAMMPVNASLLEALCHDMLTADGAMIDTKANRPLVRWREVVRKTLRINDRDCQREAVKRMCVDMHRAYDAANVM